MWVRIGVALVLSVVLITGVVLWQRTSSRGLRQTNVILITVDTLRADHLSLYGYPKDTSPNLRKFGERASVFTHAYAHAPVTAPSLSALLTSHYSHETRVHSNRYVLPAGARTLAEMLKEKGFRTGAVIGNLVLSRGSGFEQGFDDYDDRLDQWSSLGYERKAEHNTRAALAWLEQHRLERFFLWIHYMDPHGPYAPPPPYDTMFLESDSDPGPTLSVNQGFNAIGGIPEHQVLGEHRNLGYYLAQYDGEIRYCDEWFGRLFGRMEEMGLLENTLVVFTADHGESLGEHNYFFDHSDFLHEELLHVPLIVRAPGQAAAGRSIDRQVGLIDVLPEILHAFGWETGERLLGRGLFAESDERPIFAETLYRVPQAAVFTSQLKLIREDRTYQAIDRKEDPGELRNLMAGDIDPTVLDKINRLKEELNAVSAQDALALGAPIERPAGAATNEKLKALGYVQ